MMITTLIIVCMFLFSALWSGAFDVWALFLLFILGLAAVYYGWIEDKKEKSRVNALKLKQLERSIRWNETYQPRSKKNRSY